MEQQLQELTLLIKQQNEILSAILSKLDTPGERRKDILSRKETLEYIGISNSKLQALMNEGLIKFSAPTPRLQYFKKEELDAFLLANSSN
jgi:hypothetical protein